MIERLASLRAQFAAYPSKLISHFDDNDPRRLKHLSLEQQKKRAKNLLREWRSTPPFTGNKAKLSDAQQVIAQDYGFSNWSALKSHILQAQIECNALQGGNPSALDAGQHVLHIRCGSDIRHGLAIAGFSGDFLVFSDPYVHGPVPATSTLEEFIRIRASYLSSDNNPPYEDVLEDLTQSYSDLEKARDYDAVYLWFEHDSYDQLILAKLLDFFANPAKRPPTLKMITITHYPGVKIFNGIGQLPPEALRVLWAGFVDVKQAQFNIGKQAWAAIRASSPQALQDLIATGTPKLPTMAKALSRHLQQLPSKHNGLNLTENLTLEILSEKGSMNAAQLFGWYTNHYEPLSFMGDSGYWQVLDDLATADHPAIAICEEGGKPKDWHVEITNTGLDLLANKVDWLELNDINTWVGGIHIDTRGGSLFRMEDPA